MIGLSLRDGLIWVDPNDATFAEVTISEENQKECFLADLGVALSFPSYYGHNLDAADECLSDLSWFGKSSIVLMVRGFGNVDPSLRETLESIFVDAEVANLPDRRLTIVTTE
jgi:RNAse (barnase) inhibitor barstar